MKYFGIAKHVSIVRYLTKQIIL